MIEISVVEKRIEEIAAQSGAKFKVFGASNKSDSMYYGVEFPLEIDADDGEPLSFQYAHIRVSNHQNSTNTNDSLEAAICINICDSRDVDVLLADLSAWAAQAKNQIKTV